MTTPSSNPPSPTSADLFNGLFDYSVVVNISSKVPTFRDKSATITILPIGWLPNKQSDYLTGLLAGTERRVLGSEPDIDSHKFYNAMRQVAVHCVKDWTLIDPSTGLKLTLPKDMSPEMLLAFPPILLTLVLETATISAEIPEANGESF